MIARRETRIALKAVAALTLGVSLVLACTTDGFTASNATGVPGSEALVVREDRASRGALRQPAPAVVSNDTVWVMNGVTEAQSMAVSVATQIEAQRVAAEAAAALAAQQVADAAAAEAASALAEQVRLQAAAAKMPTPARVPASPTPATGSIKEYASSLVGGGEQFACLDRLFQRESSWNPSADNPSSSAYGIPQALPGSKMASAGADWETNPETQVRWGVGYINDRYGSPCQALAASDAKGWY